MASIPTLANMMLALSTPLKDYNQSLLEGQRLQQGRLAQETGLLQLANLKRQLGTEEAVREFLRTNWESVYGPQGQGQPSLATLPTTASPLTQTTQVPGQAPQTQTIPAYPDASRYAQGPVTSGGPMPPELVQRVLPTVTPPPGQTTLGSLPTRPDPLRVLAQQNPDAARLVMQQQQAQEQQRLTAYEHLLKVRMTVHGAVAQHLQGATDQASYDAAKQRIAQLAPEYAQALPQTYAKDAILPYIKSAVDVQTNAGLQIEKMKADAEVGRYQVQLAQAGYQGLGTKVTDKLKGMSPEQVEQFGGRTTDKAIQWATEQVKADDLEYARQQEVQRGKTEAQLREEKTVSEAFGEKATRLIDPQTMEPIDTRMKVKDYQALPEGRAKEFSTSQMEQIDNIRTAVPIIEQLQGHIDKLYGPGGVLARMTETERQMLEQAPARFAEQYRQKYPELMQAQRFIESNVSSIARAISGEKGAMAEGDIERAKAAFPQLKTILDIKVWPPKVEFIQPDTRGTALRTMNTIVDTINRRARALLGNEQFTHPKLHRYQTAEEAQQQTGSSTRPPAPPDLSQPEGILPGPTTTPLPPGTFYPGGDLPAPVPAPPGAPTPGRQSQAPASAPPPARATPTEDSRSRRANQQRQSAVIPPGTTRLAGAPKYMNQRDVVEAMRQTGRSRAEVEAAARARGYTVYGSRLPLPTALA